MFTIEKGSIIFSIEKELTALSALGTAFTGSGTLALVTTLAWAAVTTPTGTETTRPTAVTGTLTGRTTGTAGWGKRGDNSGLDQISVGAVPEYSERERVGTKVN